MCHSRLATSHLTWIHPSVVQSCVDQLKARTMDFKKLRKMGWLCVAGIDNAFLYGFSCKRRGISYGINVAETRQVVVDMCYSILPCS